MKFDSQNYRSYLKGAQVERQKKNRGYSLRAMARDLGLQPSHLSAIYSGKRNLSAAMAHRVAERLGLPARERDYFCGLVEVETAATLPLREKALERLRSLRPTRGQAPVTDLSVDHFRAIADWYHLAILEMTQLDGFDFTPAAIARRLGITKVEAELAIERLERLELLRREPDTGRYIKSVEHGLFSSATPRDALKRFHDQMLVKAREALADASPGQDYFASETLSIDPAQWSAAKAKIDAFLKELVTNLSANNPEGRRTRTVHLELAFFNLMKKEEEK